MMLHPFGTPCLGALSVLLILYPTVVFTFTHGEKKSTPLFLIASPLRHGNAKEAESHIGEDEVPRPFHFWRFIEESSDGERSKDALTDNIWKGIFGVTETIKDKRESERYYPWLSQHQGSTSSLKELATKLSEILDNISRNWALEGAKTIQNEEVRLRKLNKDLRERVDELVVNGSKYSRHVLKCMNKTVFEIGLNKILEDTTECYSKSLKRIQVELRKIEEQEDQMLEKMENYGKEMFDMLTECFHKDNSPNVIECLQKVDGINIGSRIRERDDAKGLMNVAGIINEIPQVFAECTAEGLVETEAHVRKGYAQSLTCLREHET